MKRMTQFIKDFLFDSSSEFTAFKLGAVFLALTSIPGLNIIIQILAFATGSLLLCKAYVDFKKSKIEKSNKELENQKLLNELELLKKKQKLYDEN
jgi:uncharacterized protein involved in cysteine biosynthesis